MLSPAVLILLAKSLVQPARCLRRFHQQHARKPVALLADRAEPLFAARTVFARNQSQIAGHLLAALEPRNLANGQHKGQRGDRTHPWLRHQQSRLLVVIGGAFRSLVELANLDIEHRPQPLQIFSPARRPTFQGKCAKRHLTRLAPQSGLLLHAAIHRQMLQTIFHPRPNLHQLVPVNQQLPQIAHRRIRSPQPRKPTLAQKRQNVRRVALVGLLLAHITGPNLRCIADPHQVPQLFQQLHKPLTVATTLQANQRWPRQRTVKSLRLAVAVDQLEFHNLTCRGIKNRYLLPTGMEITPYNLHEGFS